MGKLFAELAQGEVALWAWDHWVRFGRTKGEGKEVGMGFYARCIFPCIMESSATGFITRGSTGDRFRYWQELLPLSVDRGSRCRD